MMSVAINPVTTSSWLTALVLAGGRSSRMGRDKALISIQGAPLLQQVCEVALQCTTRVYVVTPWVERYQPILPVACQWIQEFSLPESGQSQGPLVGFTQALGQIETEWVLLLACDLPQLQADVLHCWIGQLQHMREQSRVAGLPNSSLPIALLPRQSKGWEPLCGFYQRACLPDLVEFVAQGGRSFQPWLAQHGVQELAVPNSQMLFNCNTPEDLQTLDSRFRDGLE